MLADRNKLFEKNQLILKDNKLVSQVLILNDDY